MAGNDDEAGMQRLLEEANKKMQQEIEKLKNELLTQKAHSNNNDDSSDEHTECPYFVLVNEYIDQLNVHLHTTGEPLLPDSICANCCSPRTEKRCKKCDRPQGYDCCRFCCLKCLPSRCLSEGKCAHCSHNVAPCKRAKLTEAHDNHGIVCCMLSAPKLNHTGFPGCSCCQLVDSIQKYRIFLKMKGLEFNHYGPHVKPAAGAERYATQPKLSNHNLCIWINVLKKKETMIEQVMKYPDVGGWWCMPPEDKQGATFSSLATGSYYTKPLHTNTELIEQVEQKIRKLILEVAKEGTDEYKYFEENIPKKRCYLRVPLHPYGMPTTQLRIGINKQQGFTQKADDDKLRGYGNVYLCAMILRNFNAKQSKSSYRMVFTAGSHDTVLSKHIEKLKEKKNEYKKIEESIKKDAHLLGLDANSSNIVYDYVRTFTAQAYNSQCNEANDIIPAGSKVSPNNPKFMYGTESSQSVRDAIGEFGFYHSIADETVGVIKLDERDDNEIHKENAEQWVDINAEDATIRCKKLFYYFILKNLPYLLLKVIDVKNLNSTVDGEADAKESDEVVDELQKQFSNWKHECENDGKLCDVKSIKCRAPQLEMTNISNLDYPESKMSHSVSGHSEAERSEIKKTKKDKDDTPHSKDPGELLGNPIIKQALKEVWTGNTITLKVRQWKKIKEEYKTWVKDKLRASKYLMDIQQPELRIYFVEQFQKESSSQNENNVSANIHENNDVKTQQNKKNGKKTYKSQIVPPPKIADGIVIDVLYRRAIYKDDSYIKYERASQFDKLNFEHVEVSAEQT